MIETKKCKYCKTEIDKSAKICSNCNKKQTSKTKFIIKWALIFFILLIALNDEKDTETSSKEVTSKTISKNTKSDERAASTNTKSNDAVANENTKLDKKDIKKIKATETSIDEDPTDYLKEDEIPYMYTDTEKYIGRYVKFTGKVLAEPEKDEDGVYLQVYQDPVNVENNTIVSYMGDLDVKNGDYVIVDGEIYDTFEGENAYGGTITAPAINATSVEISSYAKIIAPAVKTLKLNQKKAQNECQVILNKVEFAKNETRVYLTINNNGNSIFSAYSFDAKLIQGKSQYEEQYNYDAEYPELQTELYPDTSTSGIISFPAIRYNKNFTLYMEGSSDDYTEEFVPYKFVIKVK